LEALFIFLEFPSPSRRIFIGSHSLPPLWFAISILQHPPPNPKEKGLESTTRKSLRKGSKNHQKGEIGETHQSLEEPHQIIYTYHEGSYKVLLAAQSSFPLTRSHREALKLVQEIPKENGR
jgi:hypothetical protein